MIATRNVHRAARAFGAGCIWVALAAFSSAAWPQAGYLHNVSGLVSIQREAGKVEAAKAGDKFDANTAYRTGGDGKLMLKFADGQVVALGADSALRVGQYHYDPASRSQNRSTIELMQGEMRFVAGLIGAANSEGVRVIAGNSVINMSPGGADFSVGVKPGAQEAGYIAVALGEISARTPSGDIGKIAAGQYAPWQPGRTPALPVPLAAAPATIQASVAAQWAAVLPASTPVEVASAARTAAAVAAVGPAMASVSVDARLAAVAEANRAQAAATANPQNAQLRAAAQGATELANLATQETAAASEAGIAAKAIATMLQDLPPTAAGPALAQVPAAPAAPPAAPVMVAVTPGAGGGCTGSKC